MNINLKTKKQFRLIAMAILIFTFILYGNSIKNEYSQDDNLVTLNNQRVEKGVKGIPDIFTTHYYYNEKSSFDYRPVVLTTFAIEFQLFGRNPHVSHFINILLYVLTCILIFLLLCELLRNYHIIFPLLITFLFIAHPLHTEVVNNLKSRDELLCLLGSIGAMMMYLKYSDSGKIKYLFYGMLCISLAVLSKIAAIVFLAIIPLTIYFFKKTEPKRILFTVLSIIPAISLYFIGQFIIVDEPFNREFYFFENPLFLEENYFNRIPAAFYTMAYYIKLLVFPHPLSFYYGYDYVPIAGWSNVISWVSMVFFIGIGIYCIIKLSKKDVLVFGILIYLIAISPFANIVFPVVGIVGERFAYIASLGFCWVLTYYLLKLFKIPFETNRKIYKFKPAFVVIIVLIFSLYSVRVISRNPDWKDILTLHRNDVKHLQRSVKANSLAGNTIYRQLFNIPAGNKRDKLINEAITCYKNAIKVYPEYSTPFNNLGNIYFIFKADYKTAKQYYQRTIKVDPEHLEAHYNLGNCYEKSGDVNNAIVNYEKTLKLDEKYYRVYPRLSSLYFERNEVRKAIDLNLKGIEHFPRSEELYINLGKVYTTKKDTLTALKYFEKAVEINPDNYKLTMHIANGYGRIGYKEKAMGYWRKAQGIKQKK